MRITGIVVALGILVSAAADADLTWVTWEASAGGNDHEYALSTTGTNWTTHKTTAESYGGYLATLKTEAENTWVKNNILHITSIHWMGLYQPEGAVGDPPVEGWEWIDGDPLDYDSDQGQWLDWENWASGQPDGYTTWSNGGYARIHADGEWSDWQGGANSYAVYERDPQQDPIPEPATVLMVLGGVAIIGLKRKLTN